MTRIPLIAITISLFALGGCSSDETPFEPAPGSASASPPLPDASSDHVRTLPPVTFSAESREAFCAAVQKAIDKGPTAGLERDNKGELLNPEVTSSEFNDALNDISNFAAPEEKGAWEEFSDLHGAAERMEYFSVDSFLENYNNLTPTVVNECGLKMP